jgi:hypothetical protein
MGRTVTGQPGKQFEVGGTTMTGLTGLTGFELLCYVLGGALFAAGFIYFGFRMGRTVTGQPGKQFEVGKMPLSEHDPYQEALSKPEEVIEDRE